MAQPSPFYITTPIYYVNARPHLGHAYTTITADVIRRFHEMKGAETFFLTGTDEHGDKIVRAAEGEKKTPKEYVDEISGEFKALWPELNIRYDRFIRTTDPDHMKVVQSILQKIYDAGDIYFSEYEGLYCFGCERFYTERELVDGNCPDHEKPPETIKESNYFFRMSRYQEWLMDHIRQNPDFIRPERYRNEVLGFLREPLEDLCISRPKSRLEWGITLPFDEKYVTYVWFDALLNYVSALGYPDGEDYKTFWPHAQHIIAKDILKPHGIYWPTMLKAAGIPVYQHLNVHGYWNVSDSKMSKSLGNVADPLNLKNVYGLDAFRYFLMREMSFGLDAGFSEEALIQRINADLANDLGNLFSRVIAMTQKYFKGNAPGGAGASSMDLGIRAEAEKAIDAFGAAMEGFAFSRALSAVWELISFMNRAIDLAAPWELAKKKDQQPRLASVMAQFLAGLRVISGLIYPAMPQTAGTMQRHLGLARDDGFFQLDRLKSWEEIPEGTEIPKAVALFPRIEAKPEKAEEAAEPKAKTKPFKDQIALDDLEKIDLRVATVIEAEAVPKARKLLKLTVDLGSETRTIVAGIAEKYTPDALVGKQVVVVANLKPAKLMGVLSQGMLLAAVDEEGTSVVTLDRQVNSGTPLR